MLKTLLKKQMMEIFRSYFYDSKKNRKRPRITTIVYICLYAVLMLGVLGGIFSFLAFTICGPLVSVGMNWLYFTLMGLISILLGAFGSVFNTYSSLYLAKDNDLLLSMPIQVRHIMTARLLSVYLMGLMYSAIVMVPALIVYWVNVPVSAVTVLGGILLTLLISLIVLILSCALGWLVAKISLKLKNRSFITAIISLVFIGAYYFFYFRAQQMISDLIANAVLYGQSILGSAYPLYVFGRVGEGDAAAMGIASAVVIAVFALTAFAMSKSFLKIATSSCNTRKAVYREARAQKLSVSQALLIKELKRFSSSSAYMLNCGMGTFILPVCGVLILIKGGEFLGTIVQVLGDMRGCIPVLICAGICLISSMNNMAAPSVSLEGKSLWIVKSLPISAWQILRAKLLMQLLLTAIPTLLCSICASAMLECTAFEHVLVIVMPIAFNIFSACMALFAGIKLPNLNWTNEIVPIKQGGSVAIALFGDWIYAAALGGIYFAVSKVISPAIYMMLATTITAALALIILIVLKRNATKMVSDL